MNKKYLYKIFIPISYTTGAGGQIPAGLYDVIWDNEDYDRTPSVAIIKFNTIDHSISFMRHHMFEIWNPQKDEAYAVLDTYTFETAWSSIPKLIKRISLQFPNVKIIYKYADEDFSYNTGEYHFLNGEEIYSYHPEGGSNEAFALALEVRPEYNDDVEFVDGHYQWKED